VSDVIRSGDSYYIFRVKNIVPRSAMGLQEVQDQIYAAVYQQKVEEKLASWLKDLKDKAYIKILQ
jgi:parvulin-like peptidyl-prolyl isomerase